MCREQELLLPYLKAMIRMNKISCVLIDDENPSLVVLSGLLAKYCPDIDIVARSRNITEAYNAITSHQPDLIFLDIQMPGGDGFELLRKFEAVNFDIIFITSFDKYAMNAIKFSALDYLLKPIVINDLLQSMEKVRKRKAEKEKHHQWVLHLLDNMDSAEPSKKIVIHHQAQVKLLQLSDIVCFEAESNYTNVFMNDGIKYTPARLLKEFEDYLANHVNFIRINKKAIVNLDYITGHSKGEPFILFLKNGKEYDVSRRKKTEIMRRIK